jgi:hypothetical protein
MLSLFCTICFEYGMQSAAGVFAEYAGSTLMERQWSNDDCFLILAIPMDNRKEQGSVVLLTAVLLPVLIFVVGLGVDFGVMYTVRNAAQNAADAAAMAGVYEYACAQNGGNCPALGQTYTTDSTGNTAAQHAFNANPFRLSGTRQWLLGGCASPIFRPAHT